MEDAQGRRKKYDVAVFSVCVFFKWLELTYNKRKPLQKGKLNVEYICQ